MDRSEQEPLTVSTASEYQVDVGDHPSVMLWLKHLARADVDGFMLLIGPNQKTFTALWGRPDHSNDGSKGWTHGWDLYENSLRWVVLTGPAGTIFRLRCPVPGDVYLSDPKVAVGITAFLSALVGRLVD